VWALAQTSGNDVFYRNPYNVDENLFVDISSPSSSRYASVAALGTPEAAAKRTLAQFLEELMSTRLGVRRQGEVVSATTRTADDGKEYYDIEARLGSGCKTLLQRRAATWLRRRWARPSCARQSSALECRSLVAGIQRCVACMEPHQQEALAHSEV
jgi:hypothetical protein